MMSGMRVYITGPMSGEKEFNVPLFNEVAEELRCMGVDPTNPAEEDSDAVKESLANHPDGAAPDGLWAECLSRDVGDILTTHYDALVLLPGWATSRGSVLECTAAVLEGVTEFYIRMDEGHFTPVTVQDLGFVLSLAIFGRTNPEGVDDDATVH